MIASIRSGPGKPNQRKVSSCTFYRGIPEQKFNVNRACFPEEKLQNSEKWVKFMNFSFWHFLWFGLPGRLLIAKSGEIVSIAQEKVNRLDSGLPRIHAGPLSQRPNDL